MRQFIASTVLALALSLGAGATASAASVDGTTTPKLSNMSVAEFLDFHSKLARDLETKKYEHVNNRNRDLVAKNQKTIRETLYGRQSMADLGEVDRMAVFNAHESVVAILNDAELDKVTCRRQHKMGSRMPQTICTTARERQQVQDESRNSIVRARTCSSNCG
jgi:hypothetical protein